MTRKAGIQSRNRMHGTGPSKRTADVLRGLPRACPRVLEWERRPLFIVLLICCGFAFLISCTSPPAKATTSTESGKGTASTEGSKESTSSEFEELEDPLALCNVPHSPPIERHGRVYMKFGGREQDVTGMDFYEVFCVALTEFESETTVALHTFHCPMFLDKCSDFRVMKPKEAQAVTRGVYCAHCLTAETHSNPDGSQTRTYKRAYFRVDKPEHNAPQSDQAERVEKQTIDPLYDTNVKHSSPIHATNDSSIRPQQGQVFLAGAIHEASNINPFRTVYVVSKFPKVYHTAWCDYIKNIGVTQFGPLTEFFSKDGFAACSHCRPDMGLRPPRPE